MKQKTVLFWFLLWLMVPTSLMAQTDNQAGIVVIHEDGFIQTACVTFSEASITGSELLNRSGLSVERDVSGLGEMVCRIEETGCPGTDCLCQCQGGDACVYWSYWHLTGEGWEYSAAGAGLYEITAGAVDGWVWGAGNSGSAPEPPPITLTEICDSTVPTPEGTASVPPATALAQAQETATQATALGTLTPTEPPPNNANSSYLIFLLLVVGLLAVFLFTRKSTAK